MRGPRFDVQLVELVGVAVVVGDHSHHVMRMVAHERWSEALYPLAVGDMLYLDHHARAVQARIHKPVRRATEVTLIQWWCATDEHARSLALDVARYASRCGADVRLHMHEDVIDMPTALEVVR